MTDSIPNTAAGVAAAGFGKTGPEFYAFMAVVLVLGLVGLVLWFQGRNALLKARSLQEATQNATTAQEQSNVETHCLNQTELLSMVRQMLRAQMEGFENVLDIKLEGIKDVAEANNESLRKEFQDLKKHVDATSTKESERLAGLEKTVTEGFRTINDRFSQHLEESRGPDPQNRLGQGG